MGSSTLKPLTIAEFYNLLGAIEAYNQKKDSPQQLSLFAEVEQSLIDFSYLPELAASFMTSTLGLGDEFSQRITSLLKRGSSLAFELAKLSHHGINVATIFDEDYPQKLKKGLAAMPNSLREPPLLYYAGDLSLVQHNYVGFVGSRIIDEDDEHWTSKAVEKIHHGAEEKGETIGIVSGGSEGVDHLAQDTALSRSLPLVEFSKDMHTTLRNDDYLEAVTEKRMLLISEINPLKTLDRFERTAHYMNRNKFIYALAAYTIVVKSGLGPRSGTWSGAAEALKRNIGEVRVRDIDHEGNQDLIKKGANPLDG